MGAEVRDKPKHTVPTCTGTTVPGHRRTMLYLLTVFGPLNICPYTYPQKRREKDKVPVDTVTDMKKTSRSDVPCQVGKYQSRGQITGTEDPSTVVVGDIKKVRSRPLPKDGNSCKSNGVTEGEPTEEIVTTLLDPSYSVIGVSPSLGPYTGGVSNRGRE